MTFVYGAAPDCRNIKGFVHYCRERYAFGFKHIHLYTVQVKKSSPHKTFCNIFTQVNNISVKFCEYVASLYLHIFTDFG